MSGLTRTWRPAWPCPVRQVLGQYRRGAGDPTLRFEPGGVAWRGTRTPEGVAALAIRSRPDVGEVEAEAWGPGAAWTLDQLPALLGAEDDWADFVPHHPLLVEVRRRHPHARLGRSGLVLESLVPTIIEQKVTGQEAFAGFRALVRRFGEPAPGPGTEIGLRVQPDPATLAGIPSWEWLRCGIDPARSRAVVVAARRAVALERLLTAPIDDVDRGLRSLPGVGVWTSAEVRQRTFGDPDAVSFGDYHVARLVGEVLERRPFDDDELAAYLEAYRPQRGRVPFLVRWSGLGPERRGPRLAPRTHLPAAGRPVGRRRP